MKKILIVDDHVMIRHGLIQVLQSILDVPVSFDEASDGQQAVTMVKSCLYDLVLLDISLPGQSGLDVLKLLQQYDPKLRVIILSTHPEEHFVVRALRAGALGYVNKGSASSVLKLAIETVLAGTRYISISQANLLAEAICENSENKSLHGALSNREYQLACMMTGGKTLTEIARELSLSVKTTSTYRTRILEKLSLRTTADIINYCIHNKLSL